MKIHSRNVTWIMHLMMASSFAVLSPLVGHCAVRVWLAAQTNDWWVAGNWSDETLPADGDDVLIANGSGVLLTSSTPALASVTLTNGSVLIFSNWTTSVTADEILIASNSIMTCAGPFTNEPDMSNRVYVVCSNLTILPGGQINVSGRGYKGGDTSKNGYGPGGGTGSTWVPHGAGHGGYGGRMNGFDWQFGGVTYGNPLSPETPGSGGGGSTQAPGTAGGGAVRIAASGRVTVGGDMIADGIPDNKVRAGTGSGGSIYITCRTLVGSGRISASGGRATYTGTEAGSGGGGRIAVVNDSSAQAYEAKPSLTFLATEGLRVSNPQCRGGIGSIYLSDSRFLAGTLSNVWGRIEGPSTIHADHMDVIDRRFGFGRDVDVIVSNNVVVSGAWARLELAVSDVSYIGFPCYRTAPIGGLRFSVGGTLTLTNGARMVVGSGPLAQPEGGTGTLVSVAGRFDVGTGCWVEVRSDPTNGASPAFWCGYLTIYSNAGFTAGPWSIAGGEWTITAGGFAAAWGSVSYAGSGNRRWGWGPGGGYAGGGAGHGGAGYPYNGQGGLTNDSADAPFWPGSGGGCGNQSWGGGGIGGGLIRVVVNETARFRAGAKIEADGGNGRYFTNLDRVGGGGAGGGIYLRCRKFEADDNVHFSARGGMAALNTGGGGGGGLIAVWRVIDTSIGTVITDVSGGRGRYLNADEPAYDGEAGTVVWGWLPARGTLIYIR